MRALLLLLLPACASAYTGLVWRTPPVPDNVGAPIAVRVKQHHARRWVHATRTNPTATYGVVRVGPREFVLASRVFRANRAARHAGVSYDDASVLAWAEVRPEHRIHAARNSSRWVNATRLVATFVPGYARKHGAPPALTGPATYDAALALCTKHPEVVSVGPWQQHRTTTVFGLREMVGSSPSASSPALGAGLVRAVMDLDELDTTHCFFEDTHTPVLYAAVSNTPVPLALNAHTKIAAYATLCTGSSAPSTCASQAVTNPNQGSPQDTHATHVAGIAVGQPCATHQGVAPGARVLFLAVPAGSSADTLAVPADLYPALQTAAWANATSLTISFGGACDGAYDDMAAQIDVFAASSFATTVSVGNCGTASSLNLASSPATAKNVLRVGASLLPTAAYAGRGYSGDLDPLYVASFTSQGALIAAPGVGVLSSLASPNSGINHATFTVMDGTSMASPGVPVQAAQQALAAYGFSQAKPAMVRASIVAAAVPCTGVVDLSGDGTLTLVAGEDPTPRCGFGVPMFSNAFLTGADASWAFVSSSTSTRTTTCFAVPPGLANATLVWDEPPHVPGSPAAIYDELDLYVEAIGPTGAAHASQTDALNNHKRLGITTRSGDAYVRVTVVATHGELLEEYGRGTAAPTASGTPVEYEYVRTTQNATAPIPFVLIVRGAASGTTQQVSATNCGTCSAYEPPAPCAVQNGTGAFVCGGPCLPTSCDVGFMFSFGGDACVPYVDFSTNDAACTPPLAFNGTACVCLQPTVACPDGSSVPCSSRGFAACPPLQTPAQAAAAALSSAEYETPAPQYSAALAAGCGVAAGIIAVLFCIFSYAAWRVSNTSNDANVAGLWEFAFVCAAVGFTGAVCAATAAPIVVVWVLLAFFLGLSAWHVLATSCVPDIKTRVFFAVFTYDVLQMGAGTGALLAYCAVQADYSYTVACVVVACAYLLVALFALSLFMPTADRAGPVVVVVILCLAVVFFCTSIVSATNQDWVGFALLLVASLALAGFAAVIAREQYASAAAPDAAPAGYTSLKDASVVATAAAPSPMFRRPPRVRVVRPAGVGP